MKNYVLFIFLCIYSIVLGLILEEFLNISQMAMSNLAEQLTKEQLDKVLDLQTRWKWLSYGIIPLIFLIKTNLVAAIINLGCFFYGHEIEYKKILNIVLKSEFVFLLAIFVKGAWFYFYQTDFTLEDFQNFYPLSLLSIVDFSQLDPWLFYPFQTVNLFELAYIFLLTYFLKKALNIKFSDSFLLIAISYGIGLMLWITLVMFLLLNIY